MKSWFFILCFVLINAFPIGAQPGGEGGIQLHGIYNKAYERINPNDPSFQISAFVLDTIGQQATILCEIPAVNYRMRYIGIKPPTLHYSYYLPPIEIKNARFVLLYHGDTMLLDIAGIMSANPIGFSDFLDSLSFMPGYFSLNRNKVINNEFSDEYSPHVNYQGLTSNSLEALKAAGIAVGPKPLKHYSISPAQLHTNFYLMEAYLMYQHKMDSLAELSILKAETLGIKAEDSIRYCELKTISSNLKAEYELALTHWDCFIAQQNKLEETTVRQRMHLLKKRIGLLEKLNRKSELLASYDAILLLCEQQEDSAYYLGERFAYQRKTWGSSKNLLNEINNALSSIPSKHLTGQPYESSPWSAVFYQKGWVLWDLNMKDSAELNWWIAFRFKYEANPESWNASIDSLLASHTNRSRLYAIRAMSKHISRACKYKQRDSSCSYDLIADFQRAIDLGCSDLPTHYYQAEILHKHGQNDAALRALKFAEEHNPEDPLVYRLRLRIRKAKGENPYHDRDPDMVKFKKYMALWQFPN